MDALKLIYKYYTDDDEQRRLLIAHSRKVADRALLIARSHPELNVDCVFTEEAAMLHDIGIKWCHAPSIFCYGEEHYIRHGIIGAELLRKESLPRHARVCERHTGTGLTAQQIIAQNLPLPPKDMLPETIEEQVICYADKFYSKSNPQHEATVEEVVSSLSRFGNDVTTTFLRWASLFE